MTDGASDSLAFIRANTRPIEVPGLGVALWQADEITPIWSATEAELRRVNVAPPFWAFAWAGGQAVARHLLTHSELVAGKRVLDLACGSGLIAIAAARAGAARVWANDIDPMCAAAVAANADLNGVSIGWRSGDLLDDLPTDIDVLIAGDVFYEGPMAKRFLACFQEASKRGVTVLVGDPGRHYFPRDAFELCAEYDIVTTTEIENSPLQTARVWRL